MGHFGERLRSVRRARGLTLAGLAARIGCTKGYLSGIETGAVRPPRDVWIRKLAARLKVDSTALLVLAYRDRVPRSLRHAFDRAAVPAPARPRGDAVSRIPLLLGRGPRSYPDDLGPDGLPRGRNAGDVVIPGLPEEACFALVVREAVEPESPGGGLKPGDVVIFSRSETIRDGDAVFALLREEKKRKGLLCRVARLDEDDFVLDSGSCADRPRLCRRRDVIRFFPAVGRIVYFSSRQ
jgi:transcriptional regulator with XRE-family HTH domain